MKFSYKKTTAFTIIELIVSITLFAFILIVAFEALWNVGKDRVRISNQLDLNRDIYYAVEKFVSLVKEGGTLDYEEYWNRAQTGTGTSSGSYALYTGYGNYGSGGVAWNYGSWYYQCDQSNPNTSGNGCPGAVSGLRQRYGQYALQFIYYGVDTNGDGKVAGDDDDEDLWQWPNAIPIDASGAVRELYLIKKQTIPQERLLFRLKYESDPDAPSTITCDGSTGSGCIWKLQMLRLTGSDEWLSHSGAWVWSQDGIIDTWKCSSDFCTSAPSLSSYSADTGWIDILPSYIDVRELRFFPSPIKDVNYAWKESNINNSFVRVAMKIGFTWSRKKQLRVSDPIINITTTINL